MEAWVRKAENDLRNIELVLPAEDAPFDTVCFHAQQAAEKYLKALLTVHGRPFGKTHDLFQLLSLLPLGLAVPALVGAKLVGGIGRRTRVGDHRVIYEINDNERVVAIAAVKPRQSAHRWGVEAVPPPSSGWYN